MYGANDAGFNPSTAETIIFQKKYSGCWCPGCLDHQAISSNCFDYVAQMGLCFPWCKILIINTISVSINDTIKICLYIFTGKLHSWRCVGKTWVFRVLIYRIKAVKSEYGSDITQNDMGKIDHYQKYKKSANPIKMPPNMFKLNGHHFDKVDITGCKWKLSQWQLPAQPVIKCFGNLMTFTFQCIISSDIYVLLAFSCVNVAMVVNGLSVTSFPWKQVGKMPNPS